MDKKNSNDNEIKIKQMEIINEAIDYIFNNLDENITVDDVAKHCSYSKYHLSRIFKEFTDEALYQFIKRIRLERSAWRLKVEKDRSITDIGGIYRYSSSNFATAFKKHMSISPAQFRKKSEKVVEDNRYAHGISLNEVENNEKNITIEYLDSFFVLYERKMGNYSDMSTKWCEFIEKYEYLADKDTLYLECTIDDPSITDENKCMYELCQTISPKHQALCDDNILTHSFEGGKYAVYHFKGYPQLCLYMVYQEVFCRWLFKTGNELAEKPIFDIYRKVNDDGYMEIDICFPLK